MERGYKPDDIVRKLQELQADIYLLYELDRGVKRTSGIDMFARVEAGLGLPGKYVTESHEIDTVWRRFNFHEGRGGGERGNAVFSRFDILEYRTLELPVPPHIQPISFPMSKVFQPDTVPRKSQIFQIETARGSISIASIHLELFRLHWKDREQQLEAIIREMRTDHLLIAGDLNTVGGALKANLLRTPGGGDVAKMRAWLREKNLIDPFTDTDTTCGRLGIRAKIDWMAASPGLKVLATHSVSTNLSDHNYLVVDYDLR